MFFFSILRIYFSFHGCPSIPEVVEGDLDTPSLWRHSLLVVWELRMAKGCFIPIPSPSGCQAWGWGLVTVDLRLELNRMKKWNFDGYSC